ncbi:MAG: caspase family protein [Methyloligellaceae bacterium]
MLKRFGFAVLALAALIGASAGASAEERFALVLGNSKYQAAPALPNPVRDAESVSDLLSNAGFEVSLALDFGRADMHRAVRDFAKKIVGKGKDTVVLVYFAGHGLQIDGENYLLPVDAKIERESDVALEGLRLADVMNVLDTIPSKSRIVILDACRNNPFKQIDAKTGRGLAIVNAPAGTVVAYSTSPGTQAEDGAGTNSPFTSALVEAAQEKGAAIETVFQNVRLAVHKATKGRQTPWEVTALTEPFAFFPGAAGEKAEPKPEKSEDTWRKELKSRSPKEAYDVVVLEDNVIVYQIFVSLYPETALARRLRIIIERRFEMLAWFDAMTLNSSAAFEAFLARYPKSDLAKTAKRLLQRARQRSLVASNSPGALDIKSKPEIRTVVREVRVPEIRTVVKEVIKRVEVPVIKVKEVIKRVEVPVVRIKEVVKVKTVRVPGPTKTVVRTVRVPGPTRTVVKTVRVPVRVPCRCTGNGRRGQNSRSPSLNLRLAVPRRDFRGSGQSNRVQRVPSLNRRLSVPGRTLR